MIDDRLFVGEKIHAVNYFFLIGVLILKIFSILCVDEFGVCVCKGTVIYLLVCLFA